MKRSNLAILSGILALVTISNLFFKDDTTLATKLNLVKAVKYNGKIIPSVTLPEIEITGQRMSDVLPGTVDKKNSAEYTRGKNSNSKIIKGVNYNGEIIASVDLPVIEIIAGN